MTSSRPSVLFMTNSEYGQANVVLAVAQEVAFDSRFEVHVAAFEDLEDRVSSINVNGKLPVPITFHAVRVASMADLIKRHTGTKGLAHRPGLPYAVPAFLTLQNAILGWEPNEYMEAYRSFLNVITKVNPVALVVDPGLWQAHDAARTLGLNYLILSPSSPKDVLGTQMPKKPTLWKYPFPGSGYSYPLSLFGSVKNVILVFGAVFSMIRAGHIQRFNKVRKEANIHHPFPMAALYRQEDTILTPYVPETDWEDYNGVGMPSNHIGCGPIMLPSASSLVDSDSDLAIWLKQAPTILLNLGTHFSTDMTSAVEISKGLKFVLETLAEVQVLWKLKYDWQDNQEITRMLQPFLDAKRLRITPWLTADPATILLEGHVVCSVHHGGANSYYEACRYGLPQLVLPVWFDTYEYAERAKYLGIGLVGNTGVAPRVEGAQFGNKLLQVLQDEALHARAKAVGKACSKREGREVAAAEVKKWALAAEQTRKLE